MLALTCGTAASSDRDIERDLARFPGREEPDFNPERTAALAVVSRDDVEEGGYAHTLLLRDVARGTDAEILAFARHISVGWHPDGALFFVNDHEGSDTTNCRVGRRDADGGVTWLPTRIPASEQCWNLGAHHCYRICTAWRSDTRVEAHIVYYRDGVGSDHDFVIDVVPEDVTASGTRSP
ncbi:hypothetical protein ACQQ2N_01160 [Dokdonella sp. MW10]|uniref:hypothetical protein n=1 Tax=Dokdonella sp. MW10 TaxID=2992926 RepID=UPI003F80340E